MPIERAHSLLEDWIRQSLLACLSQVFLCGVAFPSCRYGYYLRLLLRESFVTWVNLDHDDTQGAEGFIDSEISTQGTYFSADDLCIPISDGHHGLNQAESWYDKHVEREIHVYTRVLCQAPASVLILGFPSFLHIAPTSSRFYLIVQGMLAAIWDLGDGHPLWRSAKRHPWISPTVFPEGSVAVLARSACPTAIGLRAWMVALTGCYW